MSPCIWTELLDHGFSGRIYTTACGYIYHSGKHPGQDIKYCSSCHAPIQVGTIDKDELCSALLWNWVSLRGPHVCASPSSDSITCQDCSTATNLNKESEAQILRLLGV